MPTFTLTAMLVSLEGSWHFLQNRSTDSALPQAIQLLSVILIVGQLIVSFWRAFRQIPFASYGLSFHSRYVANIMFMTNAVGVIGDGYKEVISPIYTRYLLFSGC